MGADFSILRNEKGSLVVIAMLILAVLTLLGVAATDTTDIELQISSNDRIQQNAFYAADSGWQVAVTWLDGQYPLITQDAGLDTSAPALTFSPAKYAAADGSSLGENTYTANIRFDNSTIPPGYGSEFRRYMYTLTSSATGPGGALSQVTVTAGKIEFVGGY